ncbi:hypothetical protein [Magnetospira sp. QH-2]|uniref:hypothetical protein n=1 Tax=Magnetospira sp. (strain QH-2) TaxID=1288970 RepID=UPI0011DD3EFF|nr:hypothetical protein [Magnetospira sp. QH-2]
MAKRAVCEWRAIIGLLAVSSSRGVNISSRTISVESNTPHPQAGIVPFARIADIMKPSHSTLQTGSWNEIGLLILNGKPLAFLTPSFLVCPVKSATEALQGAVPWMADRMSDPLGDASPEDLALIAKYLNQLNSGLRQLVKSENEGLVGHRLLDLIDAFVQDVRDRRRHPNPPMDPAPLGLNMPQNQSVYSLLNSASVIRHETPYEIWIPARVPLRNAFKGVIPVFASLPQQMGVEAAEIRIWNAYSLDDLLNDTANILPTIRKEAAEKGYLIVTEDDLFEPRISKFSDQRIASHPEELRNYLYPLKPLTLLLLEPAELRRNCRLRQQADRAIVDFTLTLKSVAEGTAPLSITLQRTYETPADASHEISSNLVGWPNIQSPHWSVHWLFFEADPALSSILPTVPLNLEILTEVLDKGDLPRDGVEAASSLIEAVKGQLSPLTLADDERFLSRLYRLSEPPEALAWSNELCSGDQDSRQGLLLCPVLDQAHMDPRAWSVGIDFGTTNTNVYVARGADINKARFKDRFVPYFEVHKDSDGDSLKEFFLPTGDIPVPFMTALTRRLNAETMESTPLLTHRIPFFHGDLSKSLDILFRENQSEQISFNLKWDDPDWNHTGRSRENVTIFLSQVVMMSALEIIEQGGNPAETDWWFSYPEAFLPSQIEGFEGLMPQALAKGLDIKKPEIQPKLMTESEATARHFYAANQDKGILTDTALVLDIGGQTTDVALWQAGKPRWQASLELAGRHTLIDFLAHNLTILDALSEDDATMRQAISNSLHKTNNANKKKGNKPKDNNTIEATKTISAIEIIVNSEWYKIKFSDKFPSIEPTPPMRLLHTIAEISLSGLFYYIGHNIKHLIDQGIVDPNIAPMHVCLGGRGSLLFKHYFNGQRSAKAVSILKEKSGFENIGDQLVFSTHPKEEVAHGMVVSLEDLDGNRAGADVCRSIVSGEYLQCDDKTLEADTPMHELPVANRWSTGDLTELRAMLAAFEKTFGHGIDLNDALHRVLSDRISTPIGRARGRYEQASKRAHSSHSMGGIEPPFIIAFRELIGLIIEGEVAVERGDQ